MPQTTVLQKSPSLGSALCFRGLALSDGNERDQGHSSDCLDQAMLVGAECSGNQTVSANSQHHRAPQSDVFANNGSIFSIADSPTSEKGSPNDSETIFSAEGAKEMVTSCYLPDIGPSTVDFDECFSVSKSAENLRTLESRWNDIVEHEVQLQIMEDKVECSKETGSPPIRTNDRMVTSRSLTDIAPLAIDFDECFSGSAENLRTLESRWNDIAKHEVRLQIMEDNIEENSLHKNEMQDHTNAFNDNYDGSSYMASAKEWVIPIMDEVNVENAKFSIPQLGHDVAGRSFKIKRVADWVNDLRHCSTLEAKTELLGVGDPPKKSADVPNSGWFAAKVDERASPGMEAANRYVSSLSASATIAQLSNHGLAVIPFLSAFVGLKVLNLSGNSIVKTTSGSLPRGLHALNLSKNKILVIEGLRELTRLRVLDLSYNRILRIGHGLSSCSSLKELYLAGNKISEVEGLHRLLKLAVLDLRFNKISTAKCLGQLAANYNSLQAISLEGNPAQKNVGDDQLKKHLLGLLPHLVYFNRQATKAITSKNAADRAVRLGTNSHQFDRGLRTDNKSLRKASRGASGTRLSSALVHSRKIQAVTSPKRSRGQPVLPPRVDGNRQIHLDLNSKLLPLRSELSMRRIRSEGTL